MPKKNESPFLECHATVHDWDEVSVLKAPSFGAAYDYRCTLCHSTKRVLVSRTTGAVLSRQYNHAEGYKAPYGMTKADYRKEWTEKRLKSKLRVVS
jgi:hypothetical protein